MCGKYLFSTIVFQSIVYFKDSQLTLSTFSEMFQIKVIDIIVNKDFMYIVRSFDSKIVRKSQHRPKLLEVAVTSKGSNYLVWTPRFLILIHTQTQAKL